MNLNPRNVNLNPRKQASLTNRLQRKRVRHIPFVAAVSVGGLLAGGSPAFASGAPLDSMSPDDAATIVEHVNSIDPELILDPVPTTVTAAGYAHENDEGVTVTVASNPADGVRIDSSAGAAVEISIPQAADADTAVRDATGLIHFPGTPGFTTTVLPTDGGSQFLTSIAGASAPERYTYDLSLPDGAVLTRDEASGGVIARTSEGDLLLLVAPPWAVDAAGERIDTSFEVSGTSITQIVDHHDVDVMYPVLADPTVNGHLIKSYSWHRDGSGWKISVAVTPAMGWASIYNAGVDGWNELTKAVKARSSTELTRLNTVTMKQQWICHAVGKAKIWLDTIRGTDTRPTWDLETHRGVLSGDIWKAAVTMSDRRCNW